jgi:hypothetical protein
MTLLEINTLVDKLVKRGIYPADSSGLCFSAAFSLQVFLHIHQIETTLKVGQFNGQDHFWLMLNSYEDIIIDATLTQFNDANPHVYVGPQSSNPITSQYKECQLDLVGWHAVYDRWRELILKRPDAIPRSNTFEHKAIVYILSIGAAVLAEYKTRQADLSFANSPLLSLYFDPIFTGLNNIWVSREDVLSELRKNSPDIQKLIDAAAG